MIEDLMREIEKKHKEDVLLMERQMKRIEALTRKRIELIRAVMNEHPHSIRELASVVDRDVKNVFNDLKILNSMKIVKLVKKGRCTVPKVKKKIIIMSFE